MERILTYQIQKTEEGLTVQAYLKPLGFSRRITVWLRKHTGSLLLNGVPCYTSARIREGDVLTVRIYEEKPSEGIVPAPVPFEILYEDEDLMVINKDAGIPVHPSQGNFSNTLANGLAALFAERGENFVFRAVNRLDRDTSGLLLVAKNSLSSAILSSMTAEKAVRREYLALVTGKTPEMATLTFPIARAAGSTIERCVDEKNGEPACTHYRRLAYDPLCGCSELLLSLETGRTHQIRVHMKAAGYPLPGDFLYNPDYRLISRQALHSFRLSFRHPITGRALTFTAPLPADFGFFRNPVIPSDEVLWDSDF